MLNVKFNYMDTSSRIIVVGEEPDFLSSVTDFLRQRGLECGSAIDPVSAFTTIHEFPASLLLVELSSDCMSYIEFLQAVSEKRKGMPIILVASSPTLDFAARLNGLPVTACLVKPIDYDQLLEHVRISIKHYQTLCAIQESQHRLEEWGGELTSLESVLRENPRMASFMSVESFFTLTFSNILKAIMDVRQLAVSFANPGIDPEACHLMNCPRLYELTNALRETVAVLEKTRTAFKSRELGLLRQKLESVMQIETEEKII